MKRANVAESLAWLSAVAAVGWAAWSPAHEALSRPGAPTRSRTLSTAITLAPDTLRSMIRYVVEANPFGESFVEPGGADARSQMPQGVASGGSSPLTGNSVMPRLAGIAGPPWTAVFAGVSNSQLTTVEVRDSVAGYRVVAITRDGVVLRGRDSTLRLTLTGGRP